MAKQRKSQETPGTTQKKRGRPRIHGDRKQVNLRLAVDLVARVEAAAAEAGVARDVWIAEACAIALRIYGSVAE